LTWQTPCITTIITEYQAVKGSLTDSGIELLKRNLPAPFFQGGCMNQSARGIFHAARRIIDKTSIYGGNFGAAANIVLCLLVMIGVIARYFFSYPIEWRDEICAYTFIIANLLSLCYATYAESHVSAEMLYDRFPIKVKLIIDLVGYILVLVCIAFIVYYGFQTLQSYYVRDWRSETAYEFILWPIMAIVPVGFLLFGLQCISKLIKTIERMRGNGDVPAV
jgi:C4-dicarboxylate transporter DctQ subunit